MNGHEPSDEDKSVARDALFAITDDDMNMRHHTWAEHELARRFRDYRLRGQNNPTPGRGAPCTVRREP